MITELVVTELAVTEPVEVSQYPSARHLEHLRLRGEAEASGISREEKEKRKVRVFLVNIDFNK